MKELRGTGVAMITPFNNDLSVDYAGLEKLCNHLIEGGVEYLVVQGTTGESATLTLDEKQRVLDSVVEVVNGRRPVVFGHGGNNTQALIDGFNQFNLTNVDAILSASPYYNKPTQDGILGHYRALADASPKPVIMYNVPGRTASNMSYETTVRLSEHSNIIAVKEASGDLDQVGAIIKRTDRDFLVLSGDDPLVVPHMALGGDGIISVVGNAFPAEFSEITRSCWGGEYDTARRLHYMLIDLIYSLFAEGNPAGVKAVMEILGIVGSTVRLPLAPISSELYKKLEGQVEEIRAFEKA
ncbi:MAG: 4-hydroxy-tetrahydrodipicolinate synthase [Flavobacteriales bacterium]|jgi:4-hydroxy-tetrahydrodipicolinate synthase|nr:4-hydroxy-tetrahydrodipicolinate synthase [Flavobacteriales bacterium]NCG30132.1 4-hydroxy-tetrahydrodipicolinate synthase [Bacteroidota bacterium]MBT4704357.1 4-hydroxy-tetrahydrodipicolinate synthase [Flavobacteriales bacterium]MBT4930487.1 4-hydroxy-tetrahydrodipicolinate synthase [Flavobacteriales bacterium]MBT5131763.1 4-hydroxy-tetrahydrodipicolinate synthase [Flavobacteriales bacterium]